MYSRVMLAIDSSSIAMRAADEAARMAKSRGAALILVYVIEYLHIYVQDRGYDSAPVTEALLDDARRTLSQAGNTILNQQELAKLTLVNAACAIQAWRPSGGRRACSSSNQPSLRNSAFSNSRITRSITPQPRITKPSSSGTARVSNSCCIQGV